MTLSLSNVLVEFYEIWHYCDGINMIVVIIVIII